VSESQTVVSVVTSDFRPRLSWLRLRFMKTVFSVRHVQMLKKNLNIAHIIKHNTSMVKLR